MQSSGCLQCVVGRRRYHMQMCQLRPSSRLAAPHIAHSSFVSYLLSSSNTNIHHGRQLAQEVTAAIDARQAPTAVGLRPAEASSHVCLLIAFRSAFDEVVDIIVGEGNAVKTFRLHKGALCFYSGFFEGALNGRFAEAQDGAVKLPTEDVPTFEKFVGWLYTRNFELAGDHTDYPLLCELWAFADRREIPLLSKSPFAKTAENSLRGAEADILPSQ